MTETRRRKTKVYDETINIFHDNLTAVIANNGNKPLAHLARGLDIPISTVIRWNGKNGLPTVDQLILLSRFYGVSPDWFLTRHTMSDTPATTYSQAVVLLKYLIDCGCVSSSGIKDYFISYLLKRMAEIDGRTTIPQSKKDAWFRKMYIDYDHPIMPCKPSHFYLAIATKYGDVDEDSTHLSVLRVCMDYEQGINVEEIDRLASEMYDEIEVREVERQFGYDSES